MLKQLISLLLSKFFSKQETELVGHQAMPQDGGISVTPNASSATEFTEISTFTAPADGYCMVGMRGQSTSAFVQVFTDQGAGYVNQSVSGRENQWPYTTVPMRKGANIKINASYSDNYRIKFFPTIGGGYKLLKKYSLLGGTICLKSLLACLQRNSYRTNENGWLISQQLLFKALLSYLLLQMEKVTHSRCRTRELLTSEAMAFGLLILEGSTLSISDNLRMETYRSGLTLKKVKNLPTQLGNQTSSLLPIFVYTKSRGTIDLMLGGASC